MSSINPSMYRSPLYKDVMIEIFGQFCSCEDFMIKISGRSCPCKNETKSIREGCRTFSPDDMGWCLPGPSPMWRKSLHEKYGLFDASYRSVGDWEMWCRAVVKGSVFKYIPEAYTLYYRNPDGLSSGRNMKVCYEESKRVVDLYGHLWKKS